MSEKFNTQRNLTKDQMEMVIAIKQGEGDTLLERFQIYWKKRCSNNEFLPINHVYSILKDFAMQKFTHCEYFHFYDHFRIRFLFPNSDQKEFFEEMVDGFLIAIQLMQMNYSEEEFANTSKYMLSFMGKEEDLSRLKDQIIK
jgi:hypothetical protein